MPEVTTPPGELMYMEISFFGFSASQNRSCMQIEDAMWSSTAPGHENDALLQQPRRQVIAALAPVRLLDDHRDQNVC